MAGSSCLLGKVCRDAWRYCRGAIVRVGIGRMAGMGGKPGIVWDIDVSRKVLADFVGH